MFLQFKNAHSNPFFYGILDAEIFRTKQKGKPAAETFCAAILQFGEIRAPSFAGRDASGNVQRSAWPRRFVRRCKLQHDHPGDRKRNQIWRDTTD